MSFDPLPQLPNSIAPPGFDLQSALPSPVAVAESVAEPIATPGAQPPAQAAFRWRINAAIIDNILVYGAWVLVCLAVHWRLADPAHALVLLAVGTVYYWAFETRDGQTIGKRQYGIRVMSVDGGPASPKAIAWRSVLRLVDQLPICYCSGLVNMLRTGPERRQRIGDVVAGTVVVAIDGRARERGSPRSVLPLVTVVAALLSAGFVYSILNAGSAPLTDTQRADFVAGCEQSGGAVIDCGCLLNFLTSHGYASLDALRGMMDQERAAIAAGNPSAAPPVMAEAALACRIQP